MIRKFLLLSLLAAVLAGCTGNTLKPDVGSPPTFTADAGWVTEYIDSSYFAQPPDGEAFVDFWVYASDPDGVQDITYVSVTSPAGVTWVLEDKAAGAQSHYVADGGYWGGWRRYYNSGSPNTISTGTYVAVVRDSAKHEVSESFTVTTPGTTQVGGDCVYAGTSPGGTARPMIQKAAISGFANNGTTITVTFTANDLYAINGYLWFYDSSDNFVGSTDYFSSTSFLNSGANVKATDTNTATVTASDIADLTGSFSAIRKVRVVLTDGVQYWDAHRTWYDHRSISALFGS